MNDVDESDWDFISEKYLLLVGTFQKTSDFTRLVRFGFCEIPKNFRLLSL